MQRDAGGDVKIDVTHLNRDGLAGRLHPRATRQDGDDQRDADESHSTGSVCRKNANGRTAEVASGWNRAHVPRRVPAVLDEGWMDAAAQPRCGVKPFPLRSDG